MYTNKLKNSVPDFISENNSFNGIYTSQGQELDSMEADLQDIEAQLNIDTATWALNIYEKELNIPTDITKSLEDRRSLVKSRWRGNGKLNAALFKSVCDSFTNGDVEVTFDGTIHIRFKSVLGTPPNMGDVKYALEQMKPAYLLLEYSLAFLLLGDINGTMTLGQLQQTKLDKFAGGVRIV
ncbi:MAG: DUF2313 domain-containing protein [Bacillota bacterium]|nr:DUF2313 domain-containing protein [Bacillota bacterium]